jgi:hypothetical protein
MKKKTRKSPSLRGLTLSQADKRLRDLARLGVRARVSGTAGSFAIEIPGKKKAKKKAAKKPKAPARKKKAAKKKAAKKNKR